LSDTSDTPIMLTDTQYNALKWVVGIVIPAIGTLYFAVAKIWALPAGEQVLGTLIAIQAFLGALLGISTRQYKNSDARFDGTLTTTDTPTKKIVSVETDLHPNELAKKDEVVLKVK
jgi:glucose-6-phosphate-specific signal transduction histidine kinase